MNPGCTPEFNEETRKMLAQLEQLKAQHAELSKTASRIDQVIKQNEGLRQRVESNDKSRPAKREPKEYNSQELDKAILDRKRLQSQVEELVSKGDRLNQSNAKRIADAITNVHMLNIFTSPFVYPKLGAAVVGGHALAVGQAGAISLAKLIPSFRRIADLSGRHGAGLTIEGLKARFGEGLATAPKAMKEALLQGQSNIEAAHGDVAHSTDAYWGHIGTLKDALSNELGKDKFFEATRVITSYPGRSHGVIKQLLSNPEFYQARADRGIQLVKQLINQGMTEAEAKSFTKLETTQAMIDGMAMKDAYESKMQGKNIASDAIIGAINRATHSDNPVVNAMGFIAKNIMPVARVGANVFKQGTSLIAGGAKAAAMNMKVRSEVAKALKEAPSNADAAAIYRKVMTPERADYIIKNVGQNLVGIPAFMALGMLFNKYLGGIPGAVKVPKSAYSDENSDVLKPDEAKIGNVPVGAWGFHGAPMAMMQIGAGIVKVFQQEMKGSNKNAVDAALTALGSNLWNWTERTVPELDVARRTEQTLKYARGGERKHYPYGNPWGQVLGDQIRSQVEPLGLQQWAQHTDPYKGFRSPRSLKEDMMLGIPGQRENVPKER